MALNSDQLAIISSNQSSKESMLPVSPVNTDRIC